MSSNTFELLGFSNPLDDYPSPIVPIGRLNGQLVAVYTTMKDGVSHVTETLSEEAAFDRLTPELKDALGGFDYLFDNLYAVTSTDVRKYHVADQKEFFLSLLADDNFAPDNPFARLSIAQPTGEPAIILAEIKKCYKGLGKTPRFKKAWLIQEIEQMRADGIDVAEIETLLK